jgi:hypothetical protein
MRITPHAGRTLREELVGGLCASAKMVLAMPVRGGAQASAARSGSFAKQHQAVMRGEVGKVLLVHG